MIFVLDNYDSFTYNLVQYVGMLGAHVEVEVARNDQITPEEILRKKPKGIIISPGPKTPYEAGISMELIQKTKGDVPLLGVCLGHQAIGEVFGAKTVQAESIVHGKSCLIEHNQEGIFKDIQSPTEVTRYHSLTLQPESISNQLKVTAKSQDGLIMAIESIEYPNIWGVQFHPESILTSDGFAMIKNFYERCA